jgi:hypothetical protein
MQKVVTVTTHTNIIDKDLKFTEKEYPVLDKYLQEGYKVISVTPIITGATASYMYALTFVIER